MNPALKTVMLAFSFVFFSSHNYLNGQSTRAIRDSIYTITLSFPNKSYSLRGASASNTDPNHYHSMLEVPGTYYYTISKPSDDDSWNWEGVITTSDDEEVEDRMEKIFEQWKNSIDNMGLGGARIAPYKNDRYTTENTGNFYEEGYAWRFDSGRNSIDARYPKFTIGLEALDDDGYLVARMLISDN